jgi:hypothetical protein
LRHTHCIYWDIDARAHWNCHTNHVFVLGDDR